MSSVNIPFLFVIGPQRTATTWIYKFLLTQPGGIYLDRLEKENYHFAKSSRRSAIRNRAWFINRISGSGDVRLCADVCSTYFGHQNAVERILESFPDALFVYTRRDRQSRYESFKGLREFSEFSAWILRYRVSWELYERQADFDKFDAWMKNRLPANRICVLDFADLEADGGRAWVAAISALTGVEFGPIRQGVVNKSRSGASLLRRLFFVGVRSVQTTRIHILFQRIRLRLTRPHLSSASKRGVT